MLRMTYCLLIFFLVLKKNVASVPQELFEGLSVADKFKVFTQAFNRSYENEAEKAMRFEFFKQSLKNAERLQSKEMGTAKYGINCFSDLSSEEFVQKYTSNISVEKMKSIKKEPEFSEKVEAQLLESRTRSDEPDSFDWLLTKVVPPGRDERDCTADWAFAAAGALEIMLSVRDKKATTLSVQELVDCVYEDEKPNKRGCHGGYVADAFEYMKDVGIVRAKYYKYTATDKECKYLKTKKHYKITNAFELTKKDPRHDTETVLQSKVKDYPVTVRISPEGLKHYTNGIMHLSAKDCKRRSQHNAYSALVLGYGYDEKNEQGKKVITKYWNLRTSLGLKFGEQGNMRIFRGENVCGIGNRLNWAHFR